MIGQLFALVAVVGLLLFLRRERDLYRDTHPPRWRSQESAVRELVHPRTGNVEPAPVECPIYPLEMVRVRRAQRPDRPAA